MTAVSEGKQSRFIYCEREQTPFMTFYPSQNAHFWFSHKLRFNKYIASGSQLFFEPITSAMYRGRIVPRCKIFISSPSV